MNEVDKLFCDLVGVCDRLDIPYVTIGGFAVRAHGLPRPTYDVDLVLGVERDRLAELFTAIDDAGYDVSEKYAAGGPIPFRACRLLKRRRLSMGVRSRQTSFFSGNRVSGRSPETPY